MKKIVLLFFICGWGYASSEIDNAPVEWLIAHSMQLKIADDDHLKSDQLIEQIFNTVDYNSEEDEIYINKSSLQVHTLKQNLISFIKDNHHEKTKSALYEKFTATEEERYKRKVLYRTNFAPQGHYYFNHIHTKISQDNSSLKWLKISPKKTFNKVKSFLKRRNAIGAIAITDHDTDRGYEDIKPLASHILHPLRSVEWGGKTHMCLIDIKPDWEDISIGREYSDEDSVILSRSSQGARIINHPNARYNFPYLSWLDADAVEVWNTPYENSPFLRLNIERSNNLDAFAQWINALKDNRKYTAISGSDFHFKIPCLTERMLIYPVNFIPKDDITQTKSYIKAGNISFLTRPTAPKLTLQGKFKSDNSWSVMGDTIKGKGTVDIQIFGDFSDVKKRIGGACYNVINSFYKILTFWKKRYWQLRVFNQSGELIAKQYINPKKYGPHKHFKLELELELQHNDMIRAELWEVNKKMKNVDLLGATNPISVQF